MPEESNLWALTAANSKVSQPWLLSAAGHCRDHQCESSIELLADAARLDSKNYTIQYQIGVCCSGGCRHHQQVSAEIALIHLRLALVLVDSHKDPQSRAQILDAIANTWVISARGPAEVLLQAAIKCFQEAARTYLSLGDLDAWAREEFNLGNSYCELSEETSPGKWEEAVLHYQRALKVRTRERDPVRYAATMENLGTAYRELPSGNKAVNVRKAILCYRKALQVYTLLLFPLKNAGLHNNLGNAYISMSSADSAGTYRNLRRAHRHFERALCLRAKARFPGDYAVTQLNRGSAFLRLALLERDPQLSLRSALECFEEAGNCFALCGQAECAQAARDQAESVRSYLPSPRPGEART